MPQPIADGFCHIGLVLDDQHTHPWMLRAGAFRPHIKNRIRAGNTTLLSMMAVDHTAPARAEARRVPGLVLAGPALVIAAMIGALADHSISSPATSVGDVLRGDHHAPAPASGAATTPSSGPPL